MGDWVRGIGYWCGNWYGPRGSWLACWVSSSFHVIHLDVDRYRYGDDGYSSFVVRSDDGN